MALFDANPDQPARDLLLEIRKGAMQGANHPFSTVFAIPPLAALLVRLAEDADRTAQNADRTARKVVYLTWGLVGLTVPLLALTGLLAYLEIMTR